MPIFRSKKKTLAITIGDPAGIGPEITKKALASPKIRGLANFLVIGQADKAIKPGHPSKKSGSQAIQFLEEAVEMANSNIVDAIVTAPISKEACRSAGFKFPGHTEFLASRAKTKNFAMMLVGDKLRVVLVTRHLALKDVARVLTIDKIYQTIKLTNKSLKKQFNIAQPKIAVLGLNPHAGEGGMLGAEEKNIILPAIKKAKQNKINATGPYPADALFYQAKDGKFDAIVCMYHDQGLIPLKMLAFDTGVNVTLGLPFVRTSPDHGTAFDIAGKNKANPASMIAAIRLAIELCR